MSSQSSESIPEIEAKYIECVYCNERRRVVAEVNLVCLACRGTFQDDGVIYDGQATQTARLNREVREARAARTETQQALDKAIEKANAADDRVIEAVHSQKVYQRKIINNEKEVSETNKQVKRHRDSAERTERAKRRFTR